MCASWAGPASCEPLSPKWVWPAIILFSMIAGHTHFGDSGSHDAGPAHEAHMDYGSGGHGSAAGSHAAGPAMFHFPFFSPLALATLFGAIGAYGLIAIHGF